jgi:hypothetical protein
MNEQIEELARQAADGMLSYDAEGEWKLSKREVQKFAELIVKECNKVAMDATEKAVDVALKLEREACAKLCETLELPDWPDKVRQPLAQAIRARGQA